MHLPLVVRMLVSSLTLIEVRKLLKLLTWVAIPLAGVMIMRVGCLEIFRWWVTWPTSLRSQWESLCPWLLTVMLELTPMCIIWPPYYLPNLAALSSRVFNVWSPGSTIELRN